MGKHHPFLPLEVEQQEMMNLLAFEEMNQQYCFLPQPLHLLDFVWLVERLQYWKLAELYS